MRVWAKVIAWVGVGLLGIGVILFFIGPALFASVAYPLPRQYQQVVCTEAKAFNVKPELLAGLIFTESRWDPGAQSGAGARGLTQFISSTAVAVAKRLGVSPFQPSDLQKNPELAIKFGAYYLGDLVNNRYGGDVKKALIAYNGGGAAVIGYERGYPFQGTLAYANKVMSVAEMYKKIYGDWCNREALPDLTPKSQNPVDLLTKINVGDFWRNLLSNREGQTTGSEGSSTDSSVDSFWQNILPGN